MGFFKEIWGGFFEGTRSFRTSGEIQKGEGTATLRTGRERGSFTLTQSQGLGPD
jgi:hypothetical protein